MLNLEDLSSFEAAFSKLDIDGDGTLCQNEVLDIIPAEDLGTLLKEMDQDGDGKIDYGVCFRTFNSYLNLTPTNGNIMVKGVYDRHGEKFS